MKATNIVTIIQTRRSSSRLPDKVTMLLEGKSLFVRQVERVKAAELSGTVVVATTTDTSDDLIEEICQKENIECYRGDMNDLLDRHYQAALKYNADVAIKIPSDCPLIDLKVIDKVISFFLNNMDKYDFVSNLHPATYPDGNDVEIMTMAVLKTAWEKADKQLEREHTTPYIWERPEQFRIGNVEMDGGIDYSMTHRFTIDYKEDYLFIKAIFAELFPRNPLFTIEDILKLLDERKDIYNINKDFAGVNWYRNHLDELKTVNQSQTKILEK
ncbi:cytidylyltransferase domain-containing protein [Ferruginibacter albus]|uniref:cytidylyltransferase domain-containing protein n=1 Tax=Ferruginibacter albus TaxID=2875540 RepID=UPI001CC7EDA5|nr:glycosyltransferase family protein [Ferruginibacter albus]UAY51526.1 glycosyltransferase family protein [Ferruginibacter albus]